MFAHLPRQGPHPRAAARPAAARLRRLAAALAAVICAVLASAAVVSPASAMIPIPPGGGPAVPAPAIRVVTEGGMAGWQIALIALAAALVAATAAVLVDRARAARQAAPATTA